MASLSLSARIAMTDPRSLACAWTSSVMIVKTWSDQPRITMCPVSMTRDLPLRSRSNLVMSPLASTPTSALTMKIPPSDAANISAMNGALPVSPATLPGLSVRMSVAHSMPAKPSCSAASAGVSHRLSRVTSRINPREIRPSQPIRATVPFDMAVSNQ